MDAKGFKNADLANALKITPSAVSQWLSGKTKPDRNKVLEIARILETDADALWGKVIPRITDVMQLNPTPVAAEYRRDLPVYAAAEGGGGAMLIQQSAIDFTYRSETSRGAECFAVHVVGESMSPAFAQGEQVIVDPRRVPAGGDDCIFVSVDGKGEWRAVIKRLLRVASDRWCVRQYNPAKDFDLMRSEWPKALKIIEKRFR